MADRPTGGHAEPPPRLQVRRGVEPAHVGGARRGRRRLLMGAPAASLQQHAGARCGPHARRSGGDGGVMVEDRQHQGLQYDRLGKRSRDGQDRRPGYVELALAVPTDVAGEGEVGEAPQPGVGDDPLPAQEVQFRRAEAEVLERRQQATGAGHDPEAAPRRQAAAEHLERCRKIGHTRAQCGINHRQLVLVGQEGHRRPGGRHGRYPSGLTAVPFRRISKCRWGPVDSPLEPMLPTWSRALTRLPGRTLTSDRWAYTDERPSP